MRRIYKILMSVFTILILTSIIGIAAKPTPTPDPEQVQNDRINALEINNTLQQINNTEQQQNVTDLRNWISAINSTLYDFMNIINSQMIILANRISNLENSPYPAIYGKFDPSPKRLNILTSGNNITYTDISNFTFNLPSDAYVSIESSGVITNYSFAAYVNMTVDDEDTINNMISIYTSGGSGNYQISRVYLLEAGNHTIYLRGAVYDAPYPGTFRGPDAHLTSFKVIVTDKGSFDII